MTDIRACAPPLGQVPLRRRVLNAGAWTFAGYGLSVAIRFGSSLLLTRLLVPEMFGVMAIATVVMIGLAMFSDLGVGLSVVRSERGGEPIFLNTAWAVQILRGILLWLIALVLSALLILANHIGLAPRETVYAHPILPLVIAILSISALLDGINSTKAAEARRNLNLRQITQVDIASQLIGLCCMFVWIVFDRSIWSLVAGTLGSGLARAVLTHIWLPGHPNRWQWDRAAFEEIFGFGKWIFLSSILGFLVGNGDRILLGGLMNANVLGVYSIAFSISSIVEQIVGRIVSGVAFPALSEIARERRHDLKAAYYKFHGPIAAGHIPLRGCPDDVRPVADWTALRSSLCRCGLDARGACGRPAGGSRPNCRARLSGAWTAADSLANSDPSPGRALHITALGFLRFWNPGSSRRSRGKSAFSTDFDAFLELQAEIVRPSQRAAVFAVYRCGTWCRETDFDGN